MPYSWTKRAATCRSDIMKAPAGTTSPRRWFWIKTHGPPLLFTKFAEICGCYWMFIPKSYDILWKKPWKSHDKPWSRAILIRPSLHMKSPSLAPRQGCATPPAWWHNWGARYPGALPARSGDLDPMGITPVDDVSKKNHVGSIFWTFLFVKPPKSHPLSANKNSTKRIGV